MTVTVDGGAITKIYNRLTGTDYIRGAAGSTNKDIATGLVYATAGASQGEQATVLGPTPTAKGVKVLVETLQRLSDFPEPAFSEKPDGSVEYKFTKEETELRVSYSVDPAAGDLLINVAGAGKRSGLAGVRFAVSPVACNGNLLVPAMGGIKAVAAEGRYQFESPVWKYPTAWQVPLLIFQEPEGGLWLHTQDPELRFKSARYTQEGSKGVWGLALDTETNAPFANHAAAQSVTWRLNVYSGDWTVPIDQYRAWALHSFKTAANQSSRPAWVNGIRLVIKHADDIPEKEIEAFLDELKRWTQPSKTLLFMTKWVDESKGAIMPYWVAGKRGIHFNTEAHKRGFRTMYFANYIGMTSNHPKFEEMKPYRVVNPYTGDHEGWNLKGEWKVETDIALYYINPAAKAWRENVVGQFKELFARNPADSLFIDQSFLMFNDGAGLRDGMTTVQGNIAYHRDLAQALPGIAIGGESINEVTMQYESFAEIHPLSLHVAVGANGKSQGWKIEPGAIDRMVPITPRFLAPYTKLIGYLAFPRASSPFYAGWRDSLRVYGGIPTLTTPSIEELKDRESEVRRLIREAMARP